MKTWFKAGLDTSLVGSPLQTFFQWRAAHKLTVLAYHGVDDPVCFEQQLDYLVQATHPISLNELLEVVAGRRGLPKRAVLVTFDDGERSIFEAGLPLLRRRGIPAVTFVIAAHLDTDQPFWWAEAKALVRAGGTVRGFNTSSPEALARQLKKIPDEQRLAALAELRQTATGSVPLMPQLRWEELLLLESAGIMVGNHTLTHPCLPRCAEHKALAEITGAHELLSEILGHAPLAFAYPNGDVDHRVIRLLAALNYQSAFLFDHRLCSMPPADHFQISRVRVNSDTPLDRFRIILSGLHPALHRARRLA